MIDTVYYIIYKLQAYQYLGKKENYQTTNGMYLPEDHPKCAQKSTMVSRKILCHNVQRKQWKAPGSAKLISSEYLKYKVLKSSNVYDNDILTFLY